MDVEKWRLIRNTLKILHELCSEPNEDVSKALETVYTTIKRQYHVKTKEPTSDRTLSKLKTIMHKFKPFVSNPNGSSVLFRAPRRHIPVGILFVILQPGANIDSLNSEWLDAPPENKNFASGWDNVVKSNLSLGTAFLIVDRGSTRTGASSKTLAPQTNWTCFLLYKTNESSSSWQLGAHIVGVKTRISSFVVQIRLLGQTSTRLIAFALLVRQMLSNWSYFTTPETVLTKKITLLNVERKDGCEAYVYGAKANGLIPYLEVLRPHGWNEITVDDCAQFQDSKFATTAHMEFR